MLLKRGFFVIFVLTLILKNGYSEAVKQRQQVMATLQCFTCQNCADDDDDSDNLELEMCGNSASFQPTQQKPTKKPGGGGGGATTRKLTTTTADYVEEYEDYGENGGEVELVRTTTKKATTKRVPTTTRKTTPRTTTKVAVGGGGGGDDGDDYGDYGGEDGGEEYAELKIKTRITTPPNNPSNLAIEVKSGTTTTLRASANLVTDISSTKGIESNNTKDSTAFASSADSSSSTSISLPSNSDSGSVTTASSANSSIPNSTDDDFYYEEYENYFEDSQKSINNRSARQAPKDDNVCYTIKLYRNKKVITNRGCASMVRRNKYLTCQALSQGLPIKDCKICDTYGCNGLTSQHNAARVTFGNSLWNISSLVLIYLGILFRTYY